LIDLVLRKQDIDSLQMEETPRKLIIFTFTLYLMFMRTVLGPVLGTSGYRAEVNTHRILAGIEF